MLPTENVLINQIPASVYSGEVQSLQSQECLANFALIDYE
jgi:hypothetical protein